MRVVGKHLWFEYHCYEGHDSTDAKLWYRSHQQVRVLRMAEHGEGSTPEIRGENGCPRLYRVRFSDGLENDVFEDELMVLRADFCRPDPPVSALTRG